ncbi:MAG: phosphate/phosphite/phosphonate ABC transporter substrate-binding protein [Spirulina sp.]
MKRRSFIGYSLLFLTSCSLTSQSYKKKLSFAVTDAEGMEELERYEKFRATLEEVLDIPIEFFPVENFVDTTPAMISGQVDLAWAGPTEYLLLKARANAVPIVTVQRPNFHSVLVVLNDSNIQSLEDVKGKTIDMYKLGSAANYIGAIKILLDAGLNPQSDFTIATPGKHTLQGLKNGTSDILARATHRYKTILQKEGEKESDYRILAEGDLLPGDIFVVSKNLDDKLIKQIQSRMLKHQDQLIQSIVSVEALSSKFKDTYFTAANDTDYDMMREVYHATGQDEYLF